MPREPQAPRRKSPCNTEHRSVAAKEKPVVPRMASQGAEAER